MVETEKKKKRKKMRKACCDSIYMQIVNSVYGGGIVWALYRVHRMKRENSNNTVSLAIQWKQDIEKMNENEL